VVRKRVAKKAAVKKAKVEARRLAKKVRKKAARIEFVFWSRGETAALFFPHDRGEETESSLFLTGKEQPFRLLFLA